ncbi:MAG: hypothetical protein R3F19_12580 [Verrucomicrobiales bacterium]
MKKNEPKDLFETALSSLKERSGEVDLAGFEHHVWSEIAIRDERGSWLQWLQGGRFLMPAPATAAVAIAAIVAGITSDSLKQNHTGNKRPSIWNSAMWNQFIL